eukprot:scaffold29681_cov54-Attheya_sp.AAC.1
MNANNRKAPSSNSSMSSGSLSTQVSPSSADEPSVTSRGHAPPPTSCTAAATTNTKTALVPACAYDDCCGYAGDEEENDADSSCCSSSHRGKDANPSPTKSPFFQRVRRRKRKRRSSPYHAATILPSMGMKMSLVFQLRMQQQQKERSSMVHDCTTTAHLAKRTRGMDAATAAMESMKNLNHPPCQAWNEQQQQQQQQQCATRIQDVGGLAAAYHSAVYKNSSNSAMSSSLYHAPLHLHPNTTVSPLEPTQGTAGKGAGTNMEPHCFLEEALSFSPYPRVVFQAQAPYRVAFSNAAYGRLVAQSTTPHNKQQHHRPPQDDHEVVSHAILSEDVAHVVQQCCQEARVGGVARVICVYSSCPSILSTTTTTTTSSPIVTHYLVQMEHGGGGGTSTKNSTTTVHTGSGGPFVTAPGPSSHKSSSKSPSSKKTTPHSGMDASYSQAIG